MSHHSQNPMGSPPACHGKIRGLTSVVEEPNFQGRFRRMFDLPAGNYSGNGKTSEVNLATLAKKMTSDFDEAKDGFDNEESGIPALYTYFGQFIDHDITFDPVSKLTRKFDPNALRDFRSPAFDLDNVYGRGPDDQPYIYDTDGVTFTLGVKLDNGDEGAKDLQRNAAGRALIGDPRNDENSIVSQFQGLMLRFHNRLVEETKKSGKQVDFDEIQQTVRWHYQWVVVYDFLERVVSQDVLDALKSHGRYDKGKIRFYKPEHKPFMPVEFSVAAYRLGHSMVRPGYRLNDAKLLPIFPSKEGANGVTVPSDDPSDGLTGFQAMGSDRGIDWGRFIDVGEKRAYGDAPKDGVEANEDMKKRLQFAYRLDTSVVAPLSVLPKSVASDKPPSLPARNLLRGLELGLPTGQSVAKLMGVKALEDSEILIGKAIDGVPKRGKGPPPKGKDEPIPLTDLPDLSVFKGNCPLWTYILAEAATNWKLVDIPVTPARQIQTPQLGQVGGRIVAEVFLGILFGDKSSFIHCDPSWVPTLPKSGDIFRLRDIVSYATGM